MKINNKSINLNSTILYPLRNQINLIGKASLSRQRIVEYGIGEWKLGSNKQDVDDGL